MAIHNEIIMCGWVVNDPMIITSDEGELLKGSCMVKIIRGVRSNGNRVKRLQYDNPLVMSSNPDDVKEMSTWKKGDIIEVKGFIASKEIKKARKCPICQTKTSTAGTLMYVQPIYLGKRESSIPEDDYPLILKKRCEISNHALIIGTLCRDPELNKTKKNVPITQYQLAINRKFRVKEDPVDDRTDYPWVKSFGDQAKLDYDSLRTGSLVFIEGAIQLRDVPRIDHCDVCDKDYEWNDWALELVPYSVEYLRDYNTQEDIEAKEKEDASKQTKEIVSNLFSEQAEGGDVNE